MKIKIRYESGTEPYYWEGEIEVTLQYHSYVLKMPDGSTIRIRRDIMEAQRD